jgi:hypothetical protein
VRIAQIIAEKLLYGLNASVCIFNYMRLGELSETFSTQSNHSQEKLFLLVEKSLHHLTADSANSQ